MYSTCFVWHHPLMPPIDGTPHPFGRANDVLFGTRETTRGGLNNRPWWDLSGCLRIWMHLEIEVDIHKTKQT